MTAPQQPFLTRLDRLLLRLGQRLVPAWERAEWLRSWQAELWYMHSRAERQEHSLTLGLLRDALWLRTESWRAALSGTVLVCLVSLAALVGLAALPVLVYTGSWRGFAELLRFELPRFAVASSLIFFVSRVHGSGSWCRSAAGSVPRWLRAHAFLTAKAALLLLFTFLASTDLSLPLEERHYFAATPLQLLFFVILALLGLRWCFHDGERRCKHCLRSLAEPARVGRPSWNFLEYNGTELSCRDGHGLLTVPELETSWCRSSMWVPRRLP